MGEEGGGWDLCSFLAVVQGLNLSDDLNRAIRWCAQFADVCVGRVMVSWCGNWVEYGGR